MKLHHYQEEGRDFLLRHPRAALYWDMGLGKSLTTLAALKQLKHRGVLVLAPLRVIQHVWPAELRKWGLPFTYRVLHGPRKDEYLREKADLYLMNFEGLPWLVRQGVTPFNTLVVDEAHRLKDSRTHRFKLLKSLLPHFERRYLLTGTPAPQSYMDLWAQFYILFEKASPLSPYITHYRTRFFYQRPWEPYKWHLQTGAEQAISALITPHVHRLDSKDWLELPERIDINVPVTLGGDALLQYRTLERDFVLALQKGEVTAANAAVLTSKLRQVANGAVYIKDRQWEEVHTEKLEALVDSIRELGTAPTVVFYEFKHDLARTRSHIEDHTTVTQDVQHWLDGHSQVLLVHPQSSGLGLNLQRAQAVIWFGLPWSLEQYKQGIARVWRQGQKHPVRVFHISAFDTVDDDVLTALAHKDATQQTLLDALKGRV